jgi:hypothetical protein
MASNSESAVSVLRWGRALVAYPLALALEIVGGAFGGWLALRKRPAAAAD